MPALTILGLALDRENDVVRDHCRVQAPLLAFACQGENSVARSFRLGCCALKPQRRLPLPAEAQIVAVPLGQGPDRQRAALQPGPVGLRSR